ncbi:hypothetical protein [Faecalibaculum rodentium]|uniref:hypothetical protein n=1 Tax=Faecalibaculum rodentium TaxID=1702221 RepID=UPI003F681083
MTDRPLRFDGLPMANHQTPGAVFGFGGRMRMVELAASAKLGDENWLNSGTKTGQTQEWEFQMVKRYKNLWEKTEILANVQKVWRKKNKKYRFR